MPIIYLWWLCPWFCFLWRWCVIFDTLRSNGYCVRTSGNRSVYQFTYFVASHLPGIIMVFHDVVANVYSWDKRLERKGEQKPEKIVVCFVQRLLIFLSRPGLIVGRECGACLYTNTTLSRLNQMWPIWEILERKGMDRWT